MNIRSPLAALVLLAVGATAPVRAAVVPPAGAGLVGGGAEMDQRVTLVPAVLSLDAAPASTQPGFGPGARVLAHLRLSARANNETAAMTAWVARVPDAETLVVVTPGQVFDPATVSAGAPLAAVRLTVRLAEVSLAGLPEAARGELRQRLKQRVTRAGQWVRLLPTGRLTSAGQPEVRLLEAAEPIHPEAATPV